MIDWPYGATIEWQYGLETNRRLILIDGALVDDPVRPSRPGHDGHRRISHRNERHPPQNRRLRAVGKNRMTHKKWRDLNTEKKGAAP